MDQGVRARLADILEAIAGIERVLTHHIPQLKPVIERMIEDGGGKGR